MSGMDSTLIAAGSLLALSGWLWAAMRLRPRHPQHADRYRPDPVELPVLGDTVTFAAVADRPPWDAAPYAPPPPMDPQEEASARAAYGELVFGTAGGMGCDSGAMAAVLDDAGQEAVLRRELHLVDELDLPGAGPPGEDGPGFPSGPTGDGQPPPSPAGDRGESERLRPTAPPAPVSWLDTQLDDLFGWVRDQWKR